MKFLSANVLKLDRSKIVIKGSRFTLDVAVGKKIAFPWASQTLLEEKILVSTFSPFFMIFFLYKL